MPTLHWIGKDKVINHHRDVPYKVLEHAYGFTAEKGKTDAHTGGGNMIIHGDNLEALKALLPKYEGKVKCIYIDPPYNTGNEGWVYNDNVNDPKIKRWLHQVVGKEGEDLSRHDKWLCMMYPRLVLLHKLLAEDGVLFISIDDNEQAYLKLICDEVFGPRHFITDAAWRVSDNSNNNALTFSEDFNHTLIYAKRSDWRPNFIDDASKRSHFKNPDNDPRGPWFDGNPVNNPGLRTNLQFNITTPSGKTIKHPPNGWRWSLETIREKLETGELRYSENEERLIRRTYLNEMEGLTPSNLWVDLEVTGHTRSAKYDLKKIFPEVPVTSLFPTPKPSRLVEYILQLATENDSIILDSFAGSGTTAHAVLNLNKQDGGKRKFILVEMEDYAETITAERVKRVITGYGEGKSKVEATSGSFDYYTLGPRLFDEHYNLNEEVGEARIREYVWYTETRTEVAPLGPPKGETKYLLGTHEDTAYYFVYEKDRLTVLNHETLALVKSKAGHYVIYADNCVLPQEFLELHGITFKKIPRDITRF